jgi:hypothetical protein
MTGFEAWPSLPLKDWQDTYTTLHMWTQIAGKIRMKLSPPINHWWHTTLYVSPRGLTTGPIPYPRGVFEIEFDFQAHALRASTSEGTRSSRALRAESVADFYRSVMDCLAGMKIAAPINLKPQEVANPIPFDQDTSHCSYDPLYAARFWQILISTSKVLGVFRSKFIGKCSPVHFFWGSFDLACTRFNGKLAPPRKGVLTGPAYSHQVSSAGFWPGGNGMEAAFYTYFAPSPEGLALEKIGPAAAGWNAQLSEFLLMYDDVRAAASPEETLLEFFESTYRAGARLADWDRAALEV